MGNRKKWAWNLALLLLVLGGTLYGLLRGSDLAQLAALLKEACWRWWAAAAVLVVAFILGEALVLWTLLRDADSARSPGHCALYSFVGFFFSCITPSAGGGQPAQVYFMRKDGVRASDSVPMLLLVTVTYKSVLLLYALGRRCFARPR